MGLELDETIHHVEIDEKNNQIKLYYQDGNLETIEIFSHSENDIKDELRKTKDDVKILLEDQANQYVSTGQYLKRDIGNIRRKMNYLDNLRIKAHQAILIPLLIFVFLGLSSPFVVYGVILTSLALVGKVIVDNVSCDKILKEQERDIDKYTFFMENKKKIEKNGQKRKKITNQEKVDIFNIDKASLEELKYLLEYDKIARDYQEEIEMEKPVAKICVKKRVNKRR